MSRSSLALAVLGFVSCGPPPVEPPHLLWSQDVSSLDNPFPDPRFVGAAGGTVTLRPGWYRPFLMKSVPNGKFRTLFDRYTVQAANDVRGFGNFGMFLFKGSEALDTSSLAGHVLRLTKRDGAWALISTDRVEHSSAVFEGTGRTAPADLPDFFGARPTTPLPEGADGMLVVTRGLRTAAGVELGRGFDFDKSPTKPDLATLAKALNLDAKDILLAMPITPARPKAAFEALKAFVHSPSGLPAVTIPATLAVHDKLPEGRWHRADAEWGQLQDYLELNDFSKPATDVGEVVFGTIAMRDLTDTDGVWKPELIAAPGTAPKQNLRFVLTVPTGPKPAGGWPVIIGAHGLGGRNTVQLGTGDEPFCMSLAQYFASKGFACLGIDAPSHGTRGNIVGFFAVENLATIRDRFREMTWDLLQLERAAPTIDVDGDGQGDLAPRMKYFGNSLGSIMGSSFMPFADSVDTAVLNVPGAGLSNILVSADIRDRLGLLIVSKTDIAFDSAEYYSSFPVFRAAGQIFLDSADPINVVASHPEGQAVLMQMGLNDFTIPNATTEDLANAFGLDRPTADVVGTTPQRVFFSVDPAKYLAPDKLPGFNGHDVFWNISLLRTQASRFLETNGHDVVTH